MLIKSLIVIVMFIILITLFRSLYFLTTEKEDSKKTVNMLKWRIGISIVFFILLVVGVLTGYIEPHGLPNVSSPVGE